MVLDIWAATAILFTLSFILLVPFITCLVARKTKRPPLPPGPLGLPIIGSLLSLEPDLHSYFSTLAQSYGPIFSLRLGTKLGVVVSSPALAKQVLKDHDAIFANRDVPVAGKEATYGGADMVWSPNGSQWRLLRKICVREMLGQSTIDAVYELRRKEVRRTIKFLLGQAGQPINIGEQMFVTVLNVVTQMLWGGTVQEGEERERLGKEFREAVGEMTKLIGVPNLSDFIPSLAWLDLQGVQKKMKVCAKKFDEIFQRMIDQRLKMDGNKTNKDFLHVLLQMKDDFNKGVAGYGDSNSSAQFSIVHLKSLLMDMVVGGTDTTSNTVEFAMAEILNKPQVLRRVKQELDTVIGNNNIVEEHHIFKLPYLRAVFKETLRLHSILPLMVPHCPTQSSIIGGYTIPKGSRIFINAWQIHRDPSIWANPLDFDPTRFLNTTHEFDFNGNNFTYFPFGSGRRICAGKAMAERMVLFALASLLHSFDWKLPDGEKLDVQEKFGILLCKKTPLVLIPEPRLRNPSLYL